VQQGNPNTRSAQPARVGLIKTRESRFESPTEKKEKEMKKIASVFALTVLAVGLVACAKPEEKPAPKTEAPKVVEEKAAPATTAPATAAPETAAPATAAPAPK
jgi:hypothetical protein